MRYRFASFELRKDSRELLSHGSPVKIQPKALDLLLYLLERRERAVDKEEILDALWPDVHLSETALTRCVMKARRAVGDDAEQQTVISTVHGHGYRFVADVEEVILGQNDPSQFDPSVRRRQRLGFSLISIVLAIVVGVTLYHRVAPKVVDWVVGDVRVAVLPIQNETGDTTLEWIETGLMSLVSADLENATDVAIIPPERALLLAGDAAGATHDDLTVDSDVDERLRRAEGASHVIAANLYKEGDLYKIEFALIGPSGRSQKRSILGKAPTELARALGETVVYMLPGMKRRPAYEKTISRDPFIMEAYARGVSSRLEGKSETARKMFEAALEQEPDNIWLQYEHAVAVRDMGEFENAERRLLQLIENIDADENPEAVSYFHNAIGYLYDDIGNQPASQQHYELMLKYATQADNKRLIAFALRNLGIAASSREDFDTAHHYYNRAMTAYYKAGVNPPPGGLISSLAILEAEQGNLAEAERYFTLALERDRINGDQKGVLISLGNVARLLHSKGDWDQSAAYYKEALDLSRELDEPAREAFNLVRWAVLKIDRGMFSDALQMSEQALDISENVGHRRIEAFAHRNLGLLYERKKEFRQARESFEAQKVIYAEFQDFSGEQTANVHLAQLTLNEGDVQSALQQAEQILEVLRKKAAGPQRAALEVAAAAKLADGATREALSFYEDALNAAEAQKETVDVARLSCRLGELHLRLDETESAAAYLGKARTLHAQMPFTLKFSAQYAFKTGDVEQARALLTQAKEMSGDHWTADDEDLLTEYRAAI